MTVVDALRICVDGRMLGPGGTGVSSYASALIRTLEEAGLGPLVLDGGGDPPARRGRARRLVRQAQAALTPFRLARSIVRPGGRRGLTAFDLYGQAHLHFRMHGRLMPVYCSGPAGIMHWTYPVPLRMAGWRNVYTVHDAIPLLRSDLTPIDPRRQRALLRAVVASADGLVTVSEAAQAEIVAALGCAPDFVRNSYQAVYVDDAPASAVDAWQAGGYYLFVGTIEPRKNLERLAAAYRSSGSIRPLLIAGPDGWRGEAIRRAIGGAGVVLLPYHSRDALLGLLRYARALLFPTLAEGFGLPVLEAMSLGTPVLTSAGGASAEVAGGAALLVDPTDVGEIAAAIRRIDRNDDLAHTLRRTGLARAAEFTPAIYAERLVRLYQDVAVAPFGC